MSLPQDTVLLTGATGHLGFRVLRYLLKAQYTVRAAVRSEAKATKIRSHHLLSQVSPDQLSFIIVPDFQVPEAFIKAVQDISYIIHVASPITSGATDSTDANEFFIKPAVRGTLGVLEAASKSPTVKRVVITSSIVALLPPSSSPSDPDLVIDASTRFPMDETSDYPTVFSKYVASKKAALLAGEDFVKTRKPHFDVIHIHPSFIFGRDDTAETIADFQASTNRIPLNLVLGTPKVDSQLWGYCHVDDVARIHVEALRGNVKGNQSFVINNDEGSWDDTKGIVQRHFPEAVEDGRLPNDAVPYKTQRMRFDVGKTVEKFGGLKGYEECLFSVVGHYLEVIGRE